MHITWRDHRCEPPWNPKVGTLPPNTIVSVEGVMYVVMESGVALVDNAGHLHRVSSELNEYVMRKSARVIHGRFRIYPIG